MVNVIYAVYEDFKDGAVATSEFKELAIDTAKECAMDSDYTIFYVMEEHHDVIFGWSGYDGTPEPDGEVTDCYSSICVASFVKDEETNQLVNLQAISN